MSSWLLYGQKDFLDLIVLLLEVLDLKQHLLIFSLELKELIRYLNIFEHFSELFDELINLVNKFASDSH